MEFIREKGGDVGYSAIDVLADLTCFIEVLDHMWMHNPHVDSTQIQYVFQVLRAAFSDHWYHAELSLSLKNGCNVVSGIKKATKGIACNNRHRIAIGFLPKFGTQAEGLWRGALRRGRGCGAMVWA